MATLNVQQTVLNETAGTEPREDVELTELLPVKQNGIYKDPDANVNENLDTDTIADGTTDALKVLRRFATDGCIEDAQDFQLRDFAFCGKLEKQSRKPRQGKGKVEDRTFEAEAGKRKRKGICKKSVVRAKSRKKRFGTPANRDDGTENGGESTSRQSVENGFRVEKRTLSEYEEGAYLDFDRSKDFSDEIYVFRREPLFPSGPFDPAAERTDFYSTDTDAALYERAIPSRGTIDDQESDLRSDKSCLSIEAIIEANYLLEGENNNVLRSAREKVRDICATTLVLDTSSNDGSSKKEVNVDDEAFSTNGNEYEEKKYCCVVCEARFKGSGGLRNHYKIVHGAGPIFKCDECGKEFPLKERLKLHVRTHTGFKPYKCPECDKSFARGGQLVQHRRTHSQVKPYRCGLCSGTFTCAANLALHVKRHNGQKDHKCEICGRAFVRRDALKKHLECLHRDVKSFLCVICNKTFKGHLPQHMRTHARDRPHGCATCGQRFAQKSQLTVHQRTHSGQRPFRCLVCWQAFAHSTALKLHTRRHTGERPFKCAECNAGFTQLPHWKKHMKCIHGRNEPYACRRCKSFFRIKNDLECHEKTCHPELGAANTDGSSNSDAIFSEIVEKPLTPPSKYRVMTVERMRLLLAVLLKRISKQERLDELGFGKRLIDEVLHDSLISAGRDPVARDGLTELETLTRNLEIFLKWTVPKEHWENFRKLNKSPEDILETLTAT
ncbi:zinc finger protein 37-like [Colletes gigas]|uniref:zinc finger protein 37-like n=1 Tax=Colletes gigas TaxID=935657 RepID=UPI001C9AF668|nr:zinc finger protein 37-like [Colletes gigas]XP_043251658.1 zinc finger protein 37-like [Colletes gigas]XP_043251659.1 zinc finger protein 37-like [Colletes gigas]XP_043251660.1 zinc finger protein 37-like [Colletes gigas]XP_043251662.1 zinc finger protein 37-like [Colletes gigas]